MLEEGRIVEQGRHEHLMRSSGQYLAMVVLQTQPGNFDESEENVSRTR